MGNRSKLKLLIQNLSLLLISLIIGFLGLEFAARGYARLTQKERTVTYDAMLGWKLTSSTSKMYYNEEIPYLIQTNSKGLRDTEHPYEKNSSSYRVVVLGDSFVFGSGGVENDELFTTGIEASLPNTEVINMGVPAFSLDQEYLFFKSQGVKYQPDAVILCLFMNDFEETFISFNTSIGRPKGYVTLEADTLNFQQPSPPCFYRLSHYSYLLGWIENKFRLVNFSRPPSEKEIQFTEDEKKHMFERLLISFASLCDERDIKLWLVYFPFKTQSEDHIIQKILEKISETSHFKYINFMEVFEEFPPRKSLYFEKDIHFNRKGHAAVAETLSDALRQQPTN